MCCDLTKHQLYQLDVLYREALRAITGLPRHTRVEELCCYAGSPTLADTYVRAWQAPTTVATGHTSHSSIRTFTLERTR